MPNINLPNGVGGSTGAALATAKPLILNAGAATNVWYVHHDGTDAASPAGQNRSDPLASFGGANGAHANAAAGDIVVFLDGHAETVTSAVTWSKNLILVGEGSSGGVPTVTFTNNAGATVMWNITATHIEMHNLKFAAQTQACSAVQVDLNGPTTALIRGCYFEADGNDDAACLDIDCAHVHMIDTTFISTGSSNSSQPATMLTSTGAGQVLIEMDGCVFSNGQFGCSSTHIADFTDGTTTKLTATSHSLLLGASMTLLEATVGYVNVQTSTGGGRVDWAEVT